MSQVYAITGSRNFPEDVPFVLQGNPASTRWRETVRGVNQIIDTKFPNQIIFYFMIFVPMLLGVGTELILILVFNSLTWGLISLGMSFVIYMIYLIWYLLRVRVAVKLIEGYIREENSLFYNARGVNIMFVNGSKYEKQRLEIQIRSQLQTAVVQQSGYDTQKGYTAVPQQQQQQQQHNMYADSYNYVSGGQPLQATTQYQYSNTSNSHNNLKQ
eukprot:TRINITY_DN3166_c0_g1_i2.p1 TRINITY_DN3166_c0_g1~~TRINITY_DN3166_c0_g1_i2.p1  ORF type:complete len:223 (-),score=53.54 TRINITY_DN3166_c0_g1_i2:52-693(-)